MLSIRIMSLTMAMVHDAISIIWFCYELMIFSNKCKIVSFFLCVFKNLFPKKKILHPNCAYNNPRNMPTFFRETKCLRNKVVVNGRV